MLTRVAILLLLLCPLCLQAAERLIALEGQEPVKVFVFAPTNAGTGPWPLAVLMPAGGSREYTAKAQFWLGKELTDRGWAIAVPISPDGKSFEGDGGMVIPEVIAALQEDESIMPGKSLLLGVSTGGSSALEIASRNPQNYLGVVAVPGRIKSSEPIPFLQGLPVFLRIAERDYFRWQKDLPDMAQFLTNAGAKVDAALVAGGRHTFTINWQELDPWLDSLK